MLRDVFANLMKTNKHLSSSRRKLPISYFDGFRFPTYLGRLSWDWCESRSSEHGMPLVNEARM